MEPDKAQSLYAERLAANTKTLLGEVVSESVDLRARLEVLQWMNHDLEGRLAETGRQLEAATRRLAELDTPDADPETAASLRVAEGAAG